MPLPWGHRKKLARLTGVIVDLSRIPAAGMVAADDRDAIDAYLDSIAEEVAEAFTPGGELQAEFERLFRRAERLPPQTRAAALGGWLKELLAADAHEADLATSTLPPEPARKATIGFKLRSPIVRDAAADDRSSSAAG